MMKKGVYVRPQVIPTKQTNPEDTMQHAAKKPLPTRDARICAVSKCSHLEFDIFYR